MSELQIEECLNLGMGLSQSISNQQFDQQPQNQGFIQQHNQQMSIPIQPFMLFGDNNSSQINSIGQQECPPINLNNNFYQNLEQMMFGDDTSDTSSTSLNMLGSNTSLMNLKKDQNFGIHFRKQSSLKLDRKQNSSQNFDNNFLLFKKTESEENTSSQNDLGYGSASTTNARQSGLNLSSQNSFTSAISTPFSKGSNTSRNMAFSASSQDSNLGYERFIPSRKNNKMHINFQSKDSLELFKKSSTKSEQTNTNSQQNKDNESISIAQLYQKHILDTSDNQKILSFNGNKSSVLVSNQFSTQPKTSFYSQQQMMEQENICDEEYFKSGSTNAGQSAQKSKKKQQLVITESTKILDAPGLEDDYYLNLLHWSAQNVISIVLKNEVFGYNYGTRKIFSLQKPDKENTYKFTSVKFSKSGRLLAIGDSLGGVQVIDAETRREVGFFQNHEDRVASLSWINDEILASGSKDRNIYCQDLRDKGIVRKYQGHRNEVCGLEWSCDQQTLASGGNDDKLFVWNIGYNQHQYKFSQHKAAVKAIAWSPHQHGLLVSGGGSRDKTIRFWNIHTGKETDCIETNSQVCSLAFTKNTNQFVSTHGYADNEIYVWKYPNPQKVKIFQGHQQRVIYMALSPDQKQIVTGASDETLRFWDAFPDAPSVKGPESTLKFSDLR